MGKADGLSQCRSKMAAAGVDPVVIDVFAHYYRRSSTARPG